MIGIKAWTRGTETIPAIDGRELHQALEVGRDFPTFMSSRIGSYGFTENEDFTTYLVERGAGTPAKEYLLTLSMAAELCLLERSDTGRALRRFILGQQSAQNCKCSGGNCAEAQSDEKPMWELTLDDMQQNTLKACIKCKTPFKGDGELCQACTHSDNVRERKADLVRERNCLNVPKDENDLVQCLIEREGDTTMTVPGSYGTIITFRRNKYGHAIAKVENPQHRSSILKSIFYRSYTPPNQEAA